MLINKFKTCKAIDLDSKMKEYVIKNYDNESLTEKLKYYFSQLNQNRAVMSQMGTVQDKLDTLKQNANIMTLYINMLTAVKAKMTFGKESYSCKIEFTWTDTIKENKYSSYNIFFEIYNAMFNLAVCYYNMGTIVAKEATEKMGHKEACNYFKYAMYLFDVIKEEACTKIPEKELPFDLFQPHLDYCKVLCELNGQLEIYHIAKEANPTMYALHGKLLNVVSQLFRRARFLADGPQTKKGTKDEYLNYFINRENYYKGLMCKEYREETRKKFKDKGEDYGLMIVYQGLFVTHLLECEKTINKCGNLVDKNAFEKMLSDEKNEGAEMQGLNDRIYHQKIPSETEITFEESNMMVMTLPKDLYLRENGDKLKLDEKVFCSDLDLLVPKQVKSMIDNYKSKMNNFISSNLNQLENEQSINNFIQNLFLPKKLTIRPGEKDIDLPPAEIPLQIWQKIEQIKRMGGIQFLNHTMQNIMNKSNFLISELENLLRSLEAEDRDDQMLRQQYRQKWFREPSQKLNMKFVQAAQQYIASLNNTKKYDLQEYNEINDNARYFSELLLPREQLLNKIPKRQDLEEKELPEEKELRNCILKLYELSDQCMSIIRPIYNELNDDSIIVGQFIDVLAKKTTEQAIYEKYKEEYEKKIAALKPISDQVKSQKELVNQTLQKNSQKIRDKPKPVISNETKEYFNTLDQYANMFMKKYDKVRKGDKYYNDLYEKISNLIQSGNDWMIKRSDEKNVILGTITGRKTGATNTRLTESALLDPERNPFTKMNVRKKK